MRHLSHYIKSTLVVCLAALTLTGCDFFDLSDENDLLNGRWASNVVPQAGDCCHLDITLTIDEDNDIVGQGTVGTPGQGVGSLNEFAVAFTGTVIDERINLAFDRKYNPGSIEGTVIRNFNDNFDIVIQVNFNGFGHSGRNIVLFPRESSP